MYNYTPTIGVQAVSNMREQEEYQKLRREIDLAIENCSKCGAGKLRFDYYQTDCNHQLLHNDSMKLMKEDYRDQNVTFNYRVKVGVGYQLLLTWFIPRYL